MYRNETKLQKMISNREKREFQVRKKRIIKLLYYKLEQISIEK